MGSLDLIRTSRKFISGRRSLSIAAAAVAVLIPVGIAFANIAILTPTIWTVDGVPGDTCTTASPTCTTIQNAIDVASSGDTINVDAGTYDAFQDNGKSLTIAGAGVGSTIIKPTTLIDTGMGHKYTADMLASVFVNNASSVTISGMTIEDNGKTPGSGGPDALVFWNASSGTIQNSNVTGTYAINGVQSGQGIAVDAGAASTTNLTVNNVAISGFQKNGIDAVDGNSKTSNAGTITLDVEGGSIAGAGPTAAIAQNGILLWNQGGGSVTGTVNGTAISNLEYTPTPEDVGVYTYGTNASFTAVSNVSFANVDLYAANTSPANALDATSGNTFDGVAPTSATPAQLGAIEDKMDGLMEGSSAGAIFILPHTWIATTNNRGIQAGVNAAASGDTVLAAPGTYHESVTVSKPLTIEGAQMGVAGANSSGTARTGSESTITGQVGITSSNVTIDGLSFTNPGSQVSITSPSTLSDIVLKNNIFSGYNSVGIPTNNAGNLAITGSFFTSPAANTESMQIKANSDPGGCSGTTVKSNVFVGATNNGAADINFSCTGSASSNVTVSGNVDRNNVGGTSFVSFAGINDGLNVTNNTVIGSTGSAIFFWGGVTGSVNISDNSVTGGSSSGVNIQDMGAPYGVNTGTFTISNNDLSNNSYGIKIGSGAVSSGAQVTANGNNLSGESVAGFSNQFETTSDTTLAANAAGNWWGSANGPHDPTSGDGSTPDTNAGSGVAATGAVNYGNWCLNSSCTPNVYTNPADGISASDATLHGTNGVNNAQGHSFWVSTSTIDTSSPSIPSDVYSTPDMGSISANASFSATLSSVTTSGVPRNLPAITAGTTYYFVAWTQVGGTWYPGTEQSFTTAPAAPTLSTPTNGATIETNNFTFTWDAVTSQAGPITYQFHSSLNPAATDGVLTSGLWTSGTLTSPSIVSSGAPDGTWYWQVRAKDANGTWGAWSPIWNVTIDTAAVTTNAADPVHTTGATLNGTNGPTAADNTSFWWGTTSAGPFASSTNPGSEFPAGWNHDSGLGAAAAGASFNEALTGLTTGTTYYFVAWSHIGGVWYPGVVKTFVTGGVAPTASATTNAAAPVGATSATLNGTNGGIAADNTSFWWGTTSAGPFASSTNPGSEFPAGWSHDAGLASAPANASFSESLAGLATSTTYYFTAWSHVGGVWYPGAVLSFKTQLDSPTITAPADGTATTSAALQQVTWTSVSGTGVTYVYQSATSNATTSDGSFAHPAYTSGALSTTSIATSGTPAGTYYLHVMAQDSSGNVSAWSPIVTVTVVSSPADLKGHLIIVKKTTNSAAASFNFDVVGTSFATTTLAVSTDPAGVGTSTTLDLSPGAYSVTEETQSGWLLKSVSCDSGSPTSITGGKSVTIATGVTTTCTFTDEPSTSSTTVVHEGNLATSTSDVAANPTKWFFYNDTTDAIDNSFGSFVSGPNPAPLGEGSVQFTLASSPDDRQNIATYQFAGTPLSEITGLEYSAYSHSGVAGSTESPFFNFNVDFNGSNTWQHRLVYVPSANGAVPQDTWNTFDMIRGGSALWTWSGYAGNGNKWPDGNTSQYRTWSSIVTAFPHASILASDGWLGVRVGEPGPAGYIGNVDNFVMTLNDGSNATTTTTDFEPDSGTSISISGVSPEPSTVGNPYTVSWTLTNTSGGATPTGTVTIEVNGSAAGGCSAAASAGSCSITPTSSGSVTLLASFTGDPGFDSSNSAGQTVTHQINAASNSSSSSAGGGGGGGNGAPTTSFSVYDLNHDGKVNLLDFNLLISNWGKTGPNVPGDFNGDDVVNLLDLNIFFIHWLI